MFQEPEIVELGSVEEKIEVLDFFTWENAEALYWPCHSRNMWAIYINEAES